MRANIPIDDLRSEELLEDWAWLVRKPYTLSAMNNFGDMFLRDESGRIDLLQLASGEIIHVAASAGEFQRLATDKENQRLWFLTSFLTELELAGLTLERGQCFSYKIPPILGGKIELSNIEVADIYVYSSLMGQVHQQVTKLPPGTKISGFTIK